VAAAAAPADDMIAQPVQYAGIATRAVALAVDAAIVQAAVFATGAVLALVASLVGGVELHTVGRALVAVAWGLAVAGYFVFFWSLAGQTPGMRLMNIRVMTYDGALPSAGRSVVRVIGLVLSILPLFAGFLPVLVDDRRRGLLDFLAGTVVSHGGSGSPDEVTPWRPPQGAMAGEGVALRGR